MATWLAFVYLVPMPDAQRDLCRLRMPSNIKVSGPLQRVMAARIKSIPAQVEDVFLFRSNGDKRRLVDIADQSRLDTWRCAES